MIASEVLARYSDSLALGQNRVMYQWLRLEQLNQWWHWLLLSLVVSLIVAHIAFWYRRDWMDLQRPAGWAMLILRLAAFAAILLYFFQLDRRTEQRIVRESKVAVLVDTSLSMTAAGTPSPSGVPSGLTRAEESNQLLANSPLIEQLAASHQVTVQRFDQSSRPTTLAAISKQDSNKSLASSPASKDFLADAGPLTLPLRSAQLLVRLATVTAALALLLIAISLLAQLWGAKLWRPGAWMLLSGAILLLLAMVLVAWAVVPHTQYPLASLWWGGVAKSIETIPAAGGESSPQQQINAQPIDPTKWADMLQPNGVQSRLGDAVRSVFDRELGNPLAGIILVTDGRSNAGVDPKSVLSAAQGARVPLYVIGLGSDRRPANLQLLEIDSPRRLYPGDRFSVSALISSVGFEGRSVSVQFLSGRKDEPMETMQIETETAVEIPGDGSLVTATVDLPPKSVGNWTYLARVVPLPGEAELSDNTMRTDVEVIERQNRVLIVAGGPLREYQFARNLLYRDKDVQSHVLLQSGDRNSSQEAQKLLEEFPADRTALSQYDAILAFDADWTKIPEASVQALEKWVGEQAGGLLIVAGSVETPKWLARSASGARSQVLRDLSPVILDVRGSALLAGGRVEGESTWPLTITADGLQAEYLWLTDDPQSSKDIWDSFAGVHTYYSAYQLKPGAKALALFSDPTSAAGGQQPIYLASQFYGAGRVIFQGGSELWRLRSLGDQYFDRYYTKMVRWISQGRLLLDSDRGVLLVDREEAVQGEQVSVRAVLKNERYEPLIQSEIVARLIDPQGLNLPLVLRPLIDGSQPGVYSGQFPVLSAGIYRVQLQLGGLASTEFLRAQVHARIPKVEMQNVERNDALLGQLASETGGQYWKGVQDALAADSAGQLAIVSAITPQDQVAYSPGAPEQEFQLRWLGWLMMLASVSLSVEWLARRVHRLA